jgi:hypothetical protein
MTETPNHAEKLNGNMMALLLIFGSVGVILMSCIAFAKMIGQAM